MQILIIIISIILFALMKCECERVRLAEKVKSLEIEIGWLKLSNDIASDENYSLENNVKRIFKEQKS